LLLYSSGSTALGGLAVIFFLYHLHSILEF